MSTEIKVVRGAVLVTGDLTAEAAATLARRHSARTRLDVWRARLSDLDALLPLQSLEELTLANCTVEDTSALHGLTSLRSLVLNQVRPSSGWDFLAELTQLHSLSILNTRGAVVLPDLAPLTSLRQLTIWGCPGVSDVGPFLALPALERVEVVDSGLTVDHVGALVASEPVRYVNAQFRTVAENAAFKALLEKHGRQRWPEGM